MKSDYEIKQTQVKELNKEIKSKQKILLHTAVCNNLPFFIMKNIYNLVLPLYARVNKEKMDEKYKVCLHSPNPNIKF
jgi:hypothetical protein